MKNQCINCKYFKLNDLSAGICRLIKGKDSPRPVKEFADYCDNWRDSGQQYHIRMGWIRSQEKIAGQRK